MKKMYHLTKEHLWRKINVPGRKLEGRTNPFFSGHCAFKFYDDVQNREHLVGVDEPTFSAWKEYGLMDSLRDHISMNEDLVVLEVPITEEGREGFVRDHCYWSPKNFRQEHGRNLFRITPFFGGMFEEPRPADEQRIVEEAIKNYRTSATWIKDYDGGFGVPEIWIPQDTPVEDIKVVGRINSGSLELAAA